MAAIIPAMPYTISYDPETNSLAVIGAILPEELAKFRVDLVTEALQLKGLTANWHAPFMELIATVNMPDPFRKKIAAIKLWRYIARVGLKEAKDYVEMVAAGTLPPPTGLEYPNLSPGDLDPRDRHLMNFV